MNPRIKVLASLPTLLVAILCLFSDETFGSFVKKVGGTYLFFSVIVVLFGVLWGAARPARVPVETKKKTTKGSAEKKAGEGEQKEPKEAVAAA